MAETYNITPENSPVTNVTLNANDLMYVNDGGTASKTTIKTDGLAVVYDGGLVSNTTVSQGGKLRVYGSANVVHLKDEGWLFVSAGGTVTSAIVSAGGNLHVSEGGTANDTTLYNGYYTYVLDKAVWNNTKIEGGFLFIYEGGTANIVTISSGGSLTVFQGGTANSATVRNGFMYVKGSASSATARGSGTLVVQAGGVVTDTLVNSGGSAKISGSAEKTTVNKMGADVAASLTVFDGGKMTSTTINSMGCMHISNGGQATSTTVNNGGLLYVSNGGQATSTFIEEYGSMHVSEDGETYDAYVSAHGNLHVSNGGKATNTFLNGGDMNASDGAIVTNVSVKQGATLHVSAGATAEGILEKGGYVDLADGVDATFLANTIQELTLSKESATVHSMTKAVDITLENFGSLTVYSGGTATGTTVNGGFLRISSGGIASDTTVTNGDFHVSSGGKATGVTTIAEGRNCYVIKGGIFDFDISGISPANAALVNNLALVTGNPTFTLTVSDTQANGTYILAGGSVDFGETISVFNTSGAELGAISVGSDLVIDDVKYTLAQAAGNKLTVTIKGASEADLTGDLNTKYDLTAGMVAANVNVNENGELNVLNGGAANNTTVNSGGEFNVLNGGEANNTTVNSSGFLVVQSGGTAEVVTVNPGGGLEILNGGAAYQVRENGGHVYIGKEGSATFVHNAFTGLALELWDWATVHSGTTATDISVASGGRLEIYAGGSATGIVAEDGARLSLIVATDTYAQGAYNGSAFEIGSSATGITLRPGFELEIGSGGTAVEIGIGSGLHLDVSSGGTAVDVTVEHGGHFTTYSGGTARNVVENGGYVQVPDGADVTFASHTINGLVFSTVATIHSGTTATHATVKTGPVFVYSGGIVSDTTVEAGLHLEGGVATDTAINSGGSFYVFSGGVADNTTVNNGGNFQLYNYDDIANNTTVNDGGYFYVAGYNTANGVVVSSGGSLYLTGKLTGNAVFETGAIVDVSGATVDFDLTQTTPGTDPLVNDLSFVMSSSTTYTLTVNGTVVNGTYSLAGGATGFDKTITVNNTLGEGIGTLSVGDVEKEIAGMQFSLALDGSDLTVTVAGGSEPDTTAPTVSNIQASITTPTNQNVTVTADFDDDVELKSRLYRLEGDSDWSAYPEGGVVVTENTTVYFKAVDTSGNECKPKFITIDNIDKVAPTITGITPSTTAPATSVTVTAVFDDDVELSTTLYRIGDGGWFNYHLEGVTVTENTTVSFKATDTAGNATTASYEVTNIETTTPDTTKPTVTNIAASTTALTNNNVFVTADFLDNVAVKSKLYKIGSGAWTAYADGVVVTENATVYFKAVDTSNNESDVAEYAVTNIDKVAPTITNITHSPTAPAKSVTVTATFADNIGLATKQYKIGTSGAWTDYVDGVIMTENGTVYFWAVDTAGNESPTVSHTVTNIDTSTPENGPLEPLNNTLLIDKTTVNTNVTEEYGTVLTAPGQEILLDKIDTVDEGGYHNHVGKSTSVLADDYKFDYAKIVLEHGAKLSFHAEATAAATFTVYSLTQNAKTKKYTLKKLQTLKLTDKDRDGVFTADSSKLLSLSVSGEYYVSMQYADKRKDVSEAYYNVTLNGGDKGSVFYPLGNNTDDWTDMKTAGWGGAIDDRGTVTAATDLVKGEWVGFGDKTDYKKITLDSAAELDFKFSVSDSHSPVKFTIGKLKETVKKSGTTYSLVTIKSATVAANKLSDELNALRLEKGEYYIKAESKNVKKDTGYDIQITDGDFYTDGDDGWNNVLLNGKKLNENEAYFYDNKLAGSGDVHLDKAGNDMSSDDYAAFSYGGNSYGGFVGFGDETDFAKLTVSQTSDVTFTFTATNDATLEIFKVTKNGEKYSKKSIQTVKYKAGSAPATSKKPVTLEVKDGVSYYVSVKATNIRKTTVDPQTYYNVSYALESKEASALSMPETASVASALAMPETAPVASALEMPMAAAAYIDSVQDKLFGETGNGLLASL